MNRGVVIAAMVVSVSSKQILFVLVTCVLIAGVWCHCWSDRLYRGRHC
jgi:hypothetical protein